MRSFRLALQKLCAFFNHREIGGEGCVVNLIEAQVLESRNDPACCNLARFHAEALAQPNAHGWRYLHNHRFGGIGKQVPNLVDLRLHGQRAGGANAGALAAVDAFHVAQQLSKGRLHADLVAAVGEVDGADALNLRAHAHAIAAEHALVGIANQRWRGLVERDGLVH